MEKEKEEENNLSAENNDAEKVKSLTPEQKKTIIEWIKYLSKELFRAIVKKVFGNSLLIAFSISMFSYGCVNNQPVIYQQKYWEGHFMNTNEFYEITKDIKLDKGESIWVLSNKTLKEAFKNFQDEND